MIKSRRIDNFLCDSCDGRFLCVQDCVTSCIEPLDGHASFKEKGYCIDCGHCNAICPQGAVSGGNVITEMENDELLQLMASKRSIRHYDKKRKIEQTVLDKIILAGQSAPTEKNRKTVRILLIKEQLKDVYNAALDWLVEYVQQTGSINPLYAPTMEMNAIREVGNPACRNTETQWKSFRTDRCGNHRRAYAIRGFVIKGWFAISRRYEVSYQQ